MTSPKTLPKLLLATTNAGKIQEYIAMLDDLPVQVVTLKAAGITAEVEETGATIRENAIIKAEAYTRLSGLPTLADDSGLEVDALGGEPGVRSARYGDKKTDKERNDLVLEKLRGVPNQWRHARFRCVIAIARPGHKVLTREGVCDGMIARLSKGSRGFGYDPIFYLPEMHLHMAELTLAIKNQISHRGKAMEGARDLVHQMLDESTVAP